MSMEFTIRNASPNDHQNISDLIHFGKNVHQHLDWRPPLEWMGNDPFVVLESGNKLLAALASPTELLDLAWIRLFACSVELDTQKAWKLLFERALNTYPSKEIPTIAALSLQNWFTYTLLTNHFRHLHNIVVLQWTGELPTKPLVSQKYMLRSMTAEDLPFVQLVDQTAFERIWQISLLEIQKAFALSLYATVIQYEDQIIGYQISTSNKNSAHLARLAIQEGFHGQHLGSALMFDLLNEFQNRNINVVTVNTQHVNHKSLALYKKMNFLTTNDYFPVLIYSP